MTQGILLSDDLIFNSRILGTAKDFGVSMIAVRDSSALLCAMDTSTPSCVMIDLSNPGLCVGPLLSNLKSNSNAPFVVAYGSHVNAAGLKAARDAGCDLVLPRSAFVEQLPAKLANWASRTM